MASRPMKDSGVEWIGDVPQDWEKIKIKRVVDIQGGSGFPIKLQGEKNGKYPFFKNSDFSNNKRELVVANNYVDEEDVNHNNFTVIPSGSIIMSKIGESMKKNHRKITINNSIIDNNLQALVLKNVREINLIFFYYLMNIIDSNWFDNKGAVPSINNNSLRNQIIYLTSKKEQQKIASFLDEKVAHIDNIIEDTKKSIEYLKAYKQSLITETVTKGLNPNVEMKDSGIEWIGEIPKHWQTVKMKRLGYVRNGLTYKPSDIVDSSEGTLVLRSGNIQESRLSFENNVYVNKKIKDDLKVNVGDILICSRNGSRNLIGKNALIENDLEATFGAFMMLFKPIANSSYIYYILNSEVFNFYLGTFLTTTINQLTKSNFESMEVVFTPDEKEQFEIANYLNKKVENLNSIIDEKYKILMELKFYKKSLIYEYVTGKKEVQ